MADLEHICCADLLEMAWAQAVIHRLAELVDGRAMPYTCPLNPSDVHGTWDGTSVTIRRFTRPRRLLDGAIGIALTPPVIRLLLAASGYTAAQIGVTVARRTRLLALLAARRAVAEADFSADQSGIEEE